MTNVYNFDEINQAEAPTIKMGGLTYKLRYPTVEEIEEIQLIKDDKGKEKALYRFVESTEKDQPDFETILKKQNLKVLQAFAKMIKKEFGVEE